MPTNQSDVSAAAGGAREASAVVRCPHCRKGTRVLSSYQHGGLLYDDSYCGFCGRNFPRPKGGTVIPFPVGIDTP